MADKAAITIATGKSSDAVSGEPIPEGTPVLHLTINKRCAPFFTAASLRRLADEVDKGCGLLFDANTPATEAERWPELGCRHAHPGWN